LFYSQKLKLQNPTLGTFCCVSSGIEPGEWYRAQIIDMHEGEQEVTVLMVDVGEIKKIALNRVRILKVCLVKMNICL
jgi:hypothetical protein